MARRVNPLVSFIAGFGTGYLNQEDKNREQARQDKQDAWQEEEHNRLRQDWAVKDAEKSAADAVPTVTHGDTIPTDGVSLAGSAPQDWQVTPEQMQAFKDNPNATAEQQASALQGINAAAAAQGGVGFDFGGRTPVANNGQLALADPAGDKKRDPWDILVDKARAKLAVNPSPENMSMAHQAVTMAADMRAKDVRDKLKAAYDAGGDDPEQVNGMLKFLSGHPNDEFPYTDIRYEKSADGKKWQFFGKLNGQGDEKHLSSYDTAVDPDMPLKDQVFQHVYSMADPKDYQAYFAAKAARGLQLREEGRADRREGREDKADARAERADVRAQTLQEATLPGVKAESDMNVAKAKVFPQILANEVAQGGLNLKIGQSTLDTAVLTRANLTAEIGEKNYNMLMKLTGGLDNTKLVKNQNGGTSVYDTKKNAKVGEFDADGNFTKEGASESESKPAPSTTKKFDHLW